MKKVPENSESHFSGWIEIWSTTDNTARHTAHRDAEPDWDWIFWHTNHNSEQSMSIHRTSFPLRFPSRAGTGVNCSHDGVRWHNWSTLKDKSLWHYLLRRKGKLYEKRYSVYVSSDKVKYTLRLLFLCWNHKINSSFAHKPFHQVQMLFAYQQHTRLSCKFLIKS